MTATVERRILPVRLGVPAQPVPESAPVERVDAATKDWYISRTSHGGGCCGMTHVFNFPASPEALLGPRDFTEEEWARLVSQTPAYNRYGYDCLPAQTAEERLEQIIKNVNQRRPMGIIEAVLTNGQLAGGCTCAMCQERQRKSGKIKQWRPVLEALGFKLVNQAINSNSKNELNVFHLNTGQK